MGKKNPPNQKTKELWYPLSHPPQQTTFVSTWRGHHPVTEVLWPSALFDVLLWLPWLWWTATATSSSDGDDAASRKVHLKQVPWLIKLKGCVFPSKHWALLLHPCPWRRSTMHSTLPAVVRMTHIDICRLPKPELHSWWVLPAREGDVPCQHSLNYWHASESCPTTHPTFSSRSRWSDLKNQCRLEMWAICSGTVFFKISSSAERAKLTSESVEITEFAGVSKQKMKYFTHMLRNKYLLAT